MKRKRDLQEKSTITKNQDMASRDRCKTRGVRNTELAKLNFKAIIRETRKDMKNDHGHKNRRNTEVKETGTHDRVGKI